MSFIVIFLTCGIYPALSFLVTIVDIGVKSACIANFSLSPVFYIVIEKYLVTAEPKMPLKVSYPPQRLTAAQRPSLLAILPKGIHTGLLDTRLIFSTQSPAA